MSVPFHKQLAPNKQAGQHVYGFDREPYLKHSNAAPYEPRVEQTLNEYIARKQEEPPRITFDEWVDSMSKEFGNYSCYSDYAGSATSLMELAWNAALTKGKL